MKNLPYQKVAQDLLAGLDPRTQDIVKKRFGFGVEEPFTLERIGKSHSITRERVRQIVDNALLILKAKIKEKRVKNALFAIFEHIENMLKQSGIKREDLLLQLLGAPDSFPYIIFLLHLGEQFFKHKETDHIHQFWTLQKEVIEKVTKQLQDFIDYFEKKKEALELQELKEANPNATFPPFTSVLEVSKHIVRTHNGKWGLKHWPHVYPRTIRDKAYLVLKDTGKPLHFREVATVIEEFQKKLPGLKLKKILPQTVHNELIKDARFILVGRGTYALSTWGYREGTVKDIIMSLLKESQKPLTKEDIVKNTLLQRKVKESTILLNLQDRKTFVKDEFGGYHVK